MEKKILIDYTINNNNSNPIINIDISNVPKNIMVKSAKLSVTLSCLAANYNVEFYLGETRKWMIENINFAVLSYSTIVFTDELQNALDSNSDEMSLRFVQISRTGSLSISKTSSFNKIEIEYISKNEYLKNVTNYDMCLSKTANAKINLISGELNIMQNDCAFGCVLPLKVSHVFNSVGTALPSNDAISEHYGNNWKLNIEQYLKKSVNAGGLEVGEYTYYDQNGKAEIIVEKLYYFDTGKVKHYVSRSDSNLSYDLNGNLQFFDGENYVKVESELATPKGLKLASSKEDIKNADLIDREPNELNELRVELKTIESRIEQTNFSINQNRRQLVLLALNEYYTFSDFTQNDNNLLDYLDYQTIIDNFFLAHGVSNYDETLYDSLYDDIKSELISLSSNILGSGSAFSDKFYEGYKDLDSIKIQVESVIYSLEILKQDLSDYENLKKKIKNQINNYVTQLPKYYLYNDEIIYGFSPITKQSTTNGDEINYTEIENIFRLNYIADNYGNSIIINYKFNTNKIDNIVDSEDNVLTFEYDSNDNLKRIIDSKENVIIFQYSSGNLKYIKFNQDYLMQYLYNNNNELVLAVGSNGLGYKFTYNNSKVVKIEDYSLLNSSNGNLTLSNMPTSIEQLNADYIGDNHIEIDYLNYLSTKLSTFKSQNFVKSVYYVFNRDGKMILKYTGNNELIKETAVQLYDYLTKEKEIAVTPIQNSADYLSDVNFNSNNFENVPQYYTLESNANSKYIAVSSSKISSLNNMLVDDNIELVLSGWAKANSAFIYNADNEDGQVSSYPIYIQNRKFELRAAIKYQNSNTTYTFKKCFDWMNTDWQYCAVPIRVDKGKVIREIKCYFDYTDNTKEDSVYFTDLKLEDAYVQEKVINNELVTSIENNYNEWVQNYSYDYNDRLVKISYTKKGSNTVLYTDKYYYNKNGQLYKIIDHNGIVAEKEFDENGLENKTKIYHKDNPAEVFYSEQKLDDKGKLVSNINELGHATNTYEYINETNIVSNIIDSKGNKLSYGYDTNNENLLQMTIDIDGESNTNTYGYTLDFLTSVSHNDFDIKYDYDNLGRITNIKVANKDYVNYSYNDSDNSVTATFSNNESFKQIKDDDGNITHIYYKPNNANEFSLIINNVYNNKGLLERVEDGNNNVIMAYSYDKFGNIITASNTQHGNSVIKTNTYDNTNILSESYAISNLNISQSYQYGYTNNKPETELMYIKLPNDIYNINKKDKLGRMKEIALLNADSEQINENNEIEEIDYADVQTSTKFNTLYNYLKNGDHTSNLVSSMWFGINNKYNGNIKYKYDEKGNIVEIKENGKLLARYQYDGLSRLIREDDKQGGVTSTLSYDAGGNITERIEYNFTLSDSLDNPIAIIPYVYGNGLNKDQLVSFNGQSIIYDSLGNPISYKSNNLIWGKCRQLLSFGNIASYTYNVNGIRTSKTTLNKTSEYYLDGTRIIAEKTTINNTQYLLQYYYGANGVTGFKLGNNVYYYKKNLQGDVVAILDENFVEIVRYTYDAWGNHIIKVYNGTDFVDISSNIDYTAISNDVVASINPFRYRGYYYDSETGFYYLNSRYYDPEIGRFINTDDISILFEGKDIINGLNLYAYCGNNPIMNTDDDGCAWWHWLIGALVVVAAAVAVVVTAGGAAAGIAVVASVLAGSAATTLGATISAGIFIGSVTTFTAFGIMAGIDSIATLSNGGSPADAVNTFSNYGESTMWATIGGGLLGGILGFAQYKSVNTFSGTKTPGKSTPYSTYKNTQAKTITHYDKNGNMWWSKHLTNHGYSGHSTPHWHLEMPHRGPYNNIIKFLIEFIKNLK